MAARKKNKNAQRKFHFLVRGLLLVERQVLVAQSVGSTFTFLPGGHVEPGEGLKQAIARELLEELGVSCTVGGYLGAVEYDWNDARGRGHYEVNHVFKISAPLVPQPIVHSLEKDSSSAGFRWMVWKAVDLRPAVLQDLIRRWSSGDTSVWWGSNVH